jgi:carbamoyl-phosphate synthase large subunit
MVGKTLEELGFTKEIEITHAAVKESVFPFVRFPGVDIILGPEMKSTGEVMGIDKDFGRAYLKSQIGAYQFLPKEGNVFISVKDKDKNAIVKIAQQLKTLGFKILSTAGTGKVLARNAVEVTILPRLQEGRPHILDYMKNKDVHLIINTPSGRMPRRDEILIRSTATLYNIPVITTVSGAIASAKAIEILRKEDIQVKSLQEYHKKIHVDV